jgi:sialidase-1
VTTIAFMRFLALFIVVPLLMGQPVRQELFRAGTEGYALFRIPGITATKRATLLAYAEARKNSGGDWGPIDIVLRRSTDGGKTWSPFRVIANVEGPKDKNPVALAQNLATAGEVTYNNPVAIADQDTGAVHFLFCLEYMRTFYMRSDDDGLTFSRPIEITQAFDAFRPEYPWKVLATGPGHGIQLRSGRLLVPVWLSTGTGGHAHRPSITSTIYSDDGGRTWKRGEIAVPDTAEFVFPNETAAAELSDGRVMLNVRSESKAHRRIVVVSSDGATAWSAPRFDHQLLEPICFGTLISAGGQQLLFANPDNLEKSSGPIEPGKSRDRKNLTVQYSPDDGTTWTAKRVIDPGWAGYSDLARREDGTIHLLYEQGARGSDVFRVESLQLVSFPLSWVASPGR